MRVLHYEPGRPMGLEDVNLLKPRSGWPLVATPHRGKLLSVRISGHYCAEVGPALEPPRLCVSPRRASKKFAQGAS